jgi:hypothetical protein
MTSAGKWQWKVWKVDNNRQKSIINTLKFSLCLKGTIAQMLLKLSEIKFFYYPLHLAGERLPNFAMYRLTCTEIRNTSAQDVNEGLQVGSLDKKKIHRERKISRQCSFKIHTYMQQPHLVLPVFFARGGN